MNTGATLGSAGSAGLAGDAMETAAAAQVHQTRPYCTPPPPPTHTRGEGVGGKYQNLDVEQAVNHEAATSHWARLGAAAGVTVCNGAR